MTFALFRSASTTVIALTVAAGASQTAIQPKGIPDDTVIKLERTQCFGPCPVYTVSIDAKGTVIYEGGKFVRVQGRQTDRIAVSRVAALLETAERIRFFELRSHYRAIRKPDGTETTITDMPTTFVTITSGGRSRRVEDYYGAPAALQEFERQIDETARTKRWIRIDEQTLQELVRGGWVPSLQERSELLRNALQYDEVAVVKALLDIGADANDPDPPLMMARSAAAARALIEAGANPSARSRIGATPLGRAAMFLPAEVTDVLIKAGAPVGQPDGDGRTPLWYAACDGNLAVVKLLVGAGADPGVHADGKSALECAQHARDNARLRRPPPPDGKPPIVTDYDGVISSLQQALAKRRRLGLP